MLKPGLQYKISQINVPNIIEKMVCNLVEERTVTIGIDSDAEPKFPLQGATENQHQIPLFSYSATADFKGPNNSCIGVKFADDVTQIMLYPLN